MIVDSAVILAGGFGTRLQSVVNDLPKPMATVANRPFLEYVLDNLLIFNIKKVVLSVGYLAEAIISHFGNSYKGMDISYSVEDTPLGTGGAIKYSLQKISSNYCFVLNGDSFFDIDFNRLEKTFFDNNADIILSLRQIENADRYGCVEIGNNNIITSFVEKGAKSGAGLINGGIYLLKKSILENFPEKFSFEKDFLEKTNKKIYTEIFTGNFIDIGVPKDYLSIASAGLKTHHYPYNSLFLDRDGVINVRIIGGYVTKTSEFEFIDKAKEAIGILSCYFKHIFVVTNQQGIGKGLMTATDADDIHNYMISSIKKNGGKIDKVYICPALAAENHIDRKPNPGMAVKAAKDFPDVDFNNSFMAGDSQSDIDFGKNAGMKTISIGSEMLGANHNFSSLHDFSQFIINNSL
jgi:D-glycero-alpha-D-manno-heptose 1-phosphate guanylyltransferase